MNRRRFLIALAVVTPLIVLFVAAKSVASWRPVALGELTPGNAIVVGSLASSSLRASSREVLLLSTGRLFDLASGQVRPLEREGLTADGKGFWSFDATNAPNLMVSQHGEKARAYPLPAADFPSFAQAPTKFIQDMVTVTAGPQRVELSLGGNYYRWNTESCVSERTGVCGWFDNRADQAISRDGERVINATLDKIITLSTRSDSITQSAALPDLKARGVGISTYGTYALYASQSAGAKVTTHVVDTVIAHVLWEFQTNNTGDSAFFSLDEKWIAISQNARKVWEIHDARTGAVARTLSLLPNTQCGAFSPDGATLYSVSNGVLYRQRAR